MLLCNFCNKECKNDNSLRNHKRFCKENPDKIDSPFIQYHKEGKHIGNHPWNKGKPSLREPWNKGKPGTFTGRTHSEETKKKMSDAIKARYANGWECVAGRSKKYDYRSSIAGDVKVDGTWELLYCHYLDFLKLTWIRNKQKFPYTKMDGKSGLISTPPNLGV